jgi:hypothetical protein
MTHYLRFPDKATGMATLTKAGFTDAEGTVLTASHIHALDVIGLIDGYSGWHVNYIGDLPSDWTVYLVTPAEPIRVFAT